MRNPLLLGKHRSGSLPCPHPALPFPLLHFLSSTPYSPQVQVLEFLKAADLCGQVLNLVIKEVEHFQVLQFCYVWWHSYENKNTQCGSRNLTLPRNASNTSFQMKERCAPSMTTTVLAIFYIFFR